MKAISLLAAVFLTAISGPAAQAGRVQFNGTFAGSQMYQFFGDPPFMVFVNTGGTADTTLGQFTLAESAVVFFADFAQVGGTGVLRFTDANGDSIFAYGTGKAGQSPDPSLRSTVITSTITGGTGRYAGAKGSFTLNELVDATGATTGSIHGSIIVRGNPH